MINELPQDWKWQLDLIAQNQHWQLSKSCQFYKNDYNYKAVVKNDKWITTRLEMAIRFDCLEPALTTFQKLSMLFTIITIYKAVMKKDKWITTRLEMAIRFDCPEPELTTFQKLSIL